MGRPKGAVSPMKGQKRRKQIKDPNKPKRATTAYFYYLQAERERCKREGKETNRIAEFTKEVSGRWKALTDTEKKIYEDKAAKDRARYEQEMAQYKGKDPNKPKRPQSAYFHFLAEFRTKNKGKFEHKEILRKAGEEWNKLTPEEKKPYEAGAEKDKARYEEDLKNYKQGGASAPKKAKIEPKSKNGQAEEDDEDDDDDEEDDDDEYDDDDDDDDE